MQNALDTVKRYLPKMISVRYNYNDYITEIMRDKIPSNVRQDVARQLYNSGSNYTELTLAVRDSYKLVSSGNIAKYKLA